jgi:membrane associated rhomboid family serine protease
MGIADRHYMRDEYHPPRATTVLIVVLIAVFLLQSALLVYGRINLDEQFALTLAGLKEGKVWQLLTFQFLHAVPWPWHVLFNCLGLYFIGRTVEETLGTKKYLWLYFLSGVAGGVLQVLTTAVLPRHEDIPVVGASAGIYGLLAIFCTLFPMREITAFIYFIPVNIRARTLLIFLGCLALFGTLIPFSNVAHAAHLGGLVVGVAYVRWSESVSEFWRRWHPLQSRQRKRELVRAAAKSKLWRTEIETPAELPPEEFISKQVDPILDKISAHGIQSLTERERKILEAARKKMAKR